MFVGWRADPRNRHKRQQRPVAKKKKNRKRNQRSRFEEAEKQCRKKVSDGDAVQNARKINILKSVRHASHVENAEQK